MEDIGFVIETLGLLATITVIVIMLLAAKNGAGLYACPPPKPKPAAPIEKLPSGLSRQLVSPTEWAKGCLLTTYRYWCPCGEELSDGPCGGAAVNAVCEKCKINYGCLDGYWGRL